MLTRITTDYHIGAKRVGGTTPESQQALRKHLRDALANQLDACDHLIAGDLFDEFTIDAADLVETYKIFSEWLAKYGKRLALIRGNHDFHPSGLKTCSSFDLLGTILQQQFPAQVTVANTVTRWKQFVLVPHLPNVETFLAEVEGLQCEEDKVLVFHANVDNHFVAESLHSLNLTMHQVDDLVSRGNLLIVGHEHQHRTLAYGGCLVLGNTVPSSIADCLGNQCKYSATVEGTEYTLSETWQSAGAYLEVYWNSLEDLPANLQFIRVTGEATALQAADVIKSISKLRQKHSAFVITNAVRIEGQEPVTTTETIKSFDVLAAIFENLNEEQQKCVKELLA
jgi:DNA repair exonuclease SbcCD nuclease subunit